MAASSEEALPARTCVGQFEMPVGFAASSINLAYHGRLLVRSAVSDHDAEKESHDGVNRGNSTGIE